MAGRRSRHHCRPLGELTLKGLPDPLEAVEVLWEPLGGAGSDLAVPLPARLAVRPAVGVVGREAELAAMAAAAGRVAAGEGRELLLVSGEAGLGKTTLVAAAARAAFDTGGWCCSATARRTSPPPTSSSPRPSATGSPRPRGPAPRPRRCRRLGAEPAGPGPVEADPRPPGLEGDRRRHRALQPRRQLSRDRPP